MPPTSIRRPMTVLVWLIMSTGCVLASPVLLAAGLLVRALTGRRRPLIVARLVVAYNVLELGVLIGCGALWLATGCGLLIRSQWSQLLHWRLVRWFFSGLAGAGRAALEIDILPEPSPEADRALESDRPLIILSRHAGPGDTIFIADLLLSRFGRRPSVVFKDSLAIDPCVDLLGHRLPQAMLDTADREEAETLIEQITAELGPRGALLLFPEGGNFTPERRRSAIRSLWRKDRHDAARRAERMPHLLPPQPSGVQAALRGNRDADVIVAAHTGLGLAAYPRQLWRDMPIGETLYTHMWLVPRSEVPDDPDEQIIWLNDWWGRIEEWVDAHPSQRERASG
jgi:1-acyl-sn-glycerol-3-phosphate acyltransferase